MQPSSRYWPPPSPPFIPAAAPQPRDDPFYKYTGPPLADILPGTVLKTRSFPYQIFGTIPTLLKTTQLLFRSTSQTGTPTVNVATELCKVAETFAEVPDGRHVAHTLGLLAHMLDPT